MTALKLQNEKMRCFGFGYVVMKQVTITEQGCIPAIRDACHRVNTV